VQFNSLKQLYSSKTDDELLVLAADPASLVEEAHSALADELQRRNLADLPLPVGVEAGTASAALLTQGSPFIVRAKWVGLWLLNTLVATLGVVATVGLLTYSTQSFVSHAARIHFVLTPYYPLPIMAGLVVGYLSYTRFKGSYRYWAWVVPAVLTLVSLVGWKAINQSSWSEAAVHFFGFMPYPDNRDQLDTSMVLYMSMAYSLGAFIQTKVQSGLNRRKVSGG
jgi:hypothetical protein